MTDAQWNVLLDVVAGRPTDPLPIGFIIDSPWLPQWFGIRILDYFTNDGSFDKLIDFTKWIDWTAPALQ